MCLFSNIIQLTNKMNKSKPIRNGVITFLILIGISSSTFAREGMWLPQLLRDLHTIDDMKANGLKLSAEQIYSVNQSSLKDAIVSFGGFCTAEVISSNGLILTNHHCGYGKIQSHSSVENDYLTNGFWAMNGKEELTNPGLTATFIIRIDDVTGRVLGGTHKDSTEAANQKIIAENIKAIKEEQKNLDSLYGYTIRPFFYGNNYYMFTTETFKDVRLVGAPPSSIGKFGGDTDNWMWPRHTGDFSMFRIYAGKDNRPAEYSEDNVPFKPRHHLPVSLKGVDQGDFTMVFGFPGRTQEYLTSYAVDYTLNQANPRKISLREKRLQIMDSDMKADHAVWIKYAAKYARVSNYHKKWIGESRGLKRLNAIDVKKQRETDYQKWADNQAKRGNPGFENLLGKYEKAYSTYSPLVAAQDYLYESAFAIEIVRLAYRFKDIETYVNSATKEKPVDEKVFEQKKNTLLKQLASHYKDYNAPTDKKIASAMLEMYNKGIPKDFRPAIMDEIIAKGYDNYVENIFSKSVLRDEKTATEFVNKMTPKSIKKWKKDPANVLFHGLYDTYIEKVSSKLKDVNYEISLMNRTYLKGLMQMHKDKPFYPDANSTLRITHGKVDNYNPRDGVIYKHYTTLGGIIDKGNLGVYDYVVPNKLKELYETKDYGQYADEAGYLPVCFTASNHTTGGNSGSPVIDAEGNLIGLNFDRNWEGTMSDIMYDPEMCRNIAVDIRYVLFIVDKYAGAGYLVEELDLVK